MLDIRPGTVYVLRDAEDRVLYIGLTSRLDMSRMAQHANTKAWWRDVKTAELHHCSTRYLARRLETVLIQDLAPIHNVQRAWEACPRCGDRKTQRGRLCVACRDFERRNDGRQRPQELIDQTRKRRKESHEGDSYEPAT